MYKQIVHRVTELIQKGFLKPGDKLPTERELAEKLSIARGTVSKAYETLSQTGIVDMVQGSGCFVSKSQNVMPATRKDQAIHVIDGCIAKLVELKFSEKEISTLFQTILLKHQQAFFDINVLAIDCNLESLSLFESQLCHIPHLKLSKMLLSEFMNLGKTVHERVSKLKAYNLILMTTSHYKESIDLVAPLRDRVIQCALTVSQQTVIDVSQIHANANIAVLCETPRFFEIVKRHLLGLGFVENQIFHVSAEQEGRDEISQKLSKIQVVVTGSRASHMGQQNISALASFKARNGMIVYFNYQIDRGTLEQIESSINEIARTTTRKHEKAVFS
jgi:DNA-binding transcriptional regulator YhcF (GntR family)